MFKLDDKVFHDTQLKSIRMVLLNCFIASTKYHGNN